MGYRPLRPLRIQQGDAHDVGTMLHHLNVFLQQHRGVTKVLICIDSECTDVNKTSRQAQDTERQLTRALKTPLVKYVVVDHSLEGWLLRDLKAVKSILGTGAKLKGLPNPEDECRPAELMRRLFHIYGKQDFRKTVHNKEIAKQIDVRLLESRSATFRKFVAALRA